MNWTLLGWITAVAAVPVAIDIAIQYGARTARESIRIDRIAAIPSDPNASAVASVVAKAPIATSDNSASVEDSTPGSNAVVRVVR